MKLHTNLSVSAWNVIKFIVIEFTLSVLFSRAWVSFQESYASRKVTQGRVVEVRTSRVGRLTPAETIAIPCIADDNTVAHSQWNIGNGTKGRILLALVNGVLLATVLTMEFGSSSAVSREKVLSKFVSSAEMRRGARLGNSSNTFQVGESFDTSFLQLEKKGGKYMRINMPNMGHSKSEGWMTIDDGRSNKIDILCGGSYQSLFNISVCNHDLLIDEPSFLPLTGEHFDGLILRRKKSDKIEKYLKTYSENELGQHKLIEGLIAEYHQNKSRKISEKNGKRTTVTCHGESQYVILENGEGEEFFPDFCIMKASDILLFKCERLSPSKDRAAKRDKRLQRLGSKSFHCQLNPKTITRIRTKMGMGIYAAAASLGLKAKAYERLIGSFEMVRNEVGMFELSAITASFGWSPEFSASGIVATGERKEYATLSIWFIAGLVLMIVYSLILFVAGLILSKQSTLSVPIDIHACLKSLPFHDLGNWETENCTNLWPRFGVRKRGGINYLSACALQNELQRNERGSQAINGRSEVKPEVE